MQEKKKADVSGSNTTPSEHNDKYIRLLKQIILSRIDRDKVMVFLFGSRVLDNHTSRADVDVGFLSDEKLSVHLFHEIRNAVEDSIIPLEVDLVDFNKTGNLFAKEAVKDIVIWNKPKGMKRNYLHWKTA